MRTIIIKDLINQLIEQLKIIDWWEESPPKVDYLKSCEPFCVDCLTFTQWLQWVFCPRMMYLIENRQELPIKSGLLPIAQEAWKGVCGDTTQLLLLIDQLDKNICCSDK